VNSTISHKIPVILHARNETRPRFAGGHLNREHIMEPRPTSHQHTSEEERRIREASLDHTIADSFPASDPPSSDPNPDDDSVLEPEPPDDIKGRTGV
jgi:hypothetical protein